MGILSDNFISEWNLRSKRGRRVLALGAMEGGGRLHTIIISIYYWEIMEWISLKI